MTSLTYEQRIKEIAEDSATRKTFEAKVKPLIDEIFEDDASRSYVLSKDRCGYGTWKVTIWLSDIKFGPNMKTFIETLFGFITHDEERQWTTLKDVESDLRELIEEFAFWQF